MQRQHKKVTNQLKALATSSKTKQAAKEKTAVNDDDSFLDVQPSPLRSNNLNKRIEVPSSATQLFVKLAKNKPAAVKVTKNLEYDSGSESEVENVKKSKLELLDSPVSSKCNLSFDSNLTSSKELVNRIERMESTVNEMGKRQEKCLLLLAQANAKMDCLLSAKEGKQLQAGVEPVKFPDLSLSPVKSLEELENAEECCKDNDYVENVVRWMQQIHGKNRFKSDGGTVCLQMIDYFVDRKFFRHCSWTGISKTFDENQELVRKIAFSKYERYINLFYAVVRNADEDFTRNDCNKFLKQCLRNSKQRLEDTNMRTPAVRNKRKVLHSYSNLNIEYLENTMGSGQESSGQDDDIENMIIDETAFLELGNNCPEPEHTNF